MKNIIIFVIVITPALCQANLLVNANPGFEIESPAGEASGWQDRGTMQSWGTDYAHGGSAALKIASPGAANYTFTWSFKGSAIRTALAPGVNYRLSGWIKAVNVNSSGARIELALNTTIATGYVTGTQDWTFVQADFTGPALGPDPASWRLDCAWDFSSGIAWFDDLSLVDLATDITPPAVPSGLVATAVSTSQINLDWNDNGATDLDHYSVYRSAAPGFTPSAANRIAAPVGASAYADTGLAPGSTWFYRVTASDESGNESGPSNATGASTFQSPDFNGDQSVDEDDLAVLVSHWLDAGSNIPGDLVSDGLVNLLDFAQLADAWTGRDTQPPSIPQDLTVTGMAFNSVSLSWSPSSDNLAVAGYRIYRNGSADPLATTANRYFTDTGVAPETAYTYQVSACDSRENESGRSAPVTLTTPAEPLAANLVANPSFEIDANGNGFADSWAERATAPRDTSLAHSGSACLHLVPGQIGALYTYQNVNVAANTEYLAGYWAKADSVIESIETMYCRAAANGATNIFKGPQVRNNTFGWKYFQDTFVTPADTTFVRFDILYSTYPSDHIWVDDVSLVRLSPEGAVSTATAPAAVVNAVQLDFSQYPADHFFPAGPLTLPTRIQNTGATSLSLEVISDLEIYVGGKPRSLVQRQTRTLALAAGTTVNANETFSPVSAGPYKFVITVRYQGQLVKEAVGTLLYDAANYSLPDYKPADFDQFWADTLTEMRTRPLDPQTHSNPPGVPSRYQWVSFNGLPGPEHDRVQAFLGKPTNIPAGERRPALLMLPGAGLGGAPLDEVCLNAGWVSLSFSVHDLPYLDGRYHFNAEYPVDVMVEQKYDGQNYMEVGLSARDTYFYRFAFANAVRAVDYLRSLPFVDPDRIAVAGGSQGGALSLAVASLVPDVALAMLNSPGRSRWDVLTYDWRATGTFDPPAGMTKVQMFSSVLAYCDTSLHARRILCPLLLGIPMNDETDPAPLQFYAYKEITQSPDKRLAVNPWGGHLEVNYDTVRQDMIRTHIGPQYAY